MWSKLLSKLASKLPRLKRQVRHTTARSCPHIFESCVENGEMLAGNRGGTVHQTHTVETWGKAAEVIFPYSREGEFGKETLLGATVP
jgi:hypothetical protein